MTQEEEFQYYLKPTVNPILHPQCTELTGITQARFSLLPRQQQHSDNEILQEQVDSGLSLPETLKRYDEWLREVGLLDKETGSFSFLFLLFYFSRSEL